MFETFEVRRPWWRKKRIWSGLFVLTLFIGLGLFFWEQTKPPENFPLNGSVNIPRGLTALEIAHLFEEQNVVRSNLMLYVILVWNYDPSNIQAGTFVFEEPLNVWQIAERLTAISSSNNLIRVTLPEGYRVSEFAELAAAVLPEFDVNAYIALSEGQEGYLFPDTYYVPGDFTVDEFVSLQAETYLQKIAPLVEDINNHPLNEYEVLILASLLEREANSEESMRMVSGILQNRLNEGMRLQVDASMEYVLGRPLNTLRPEDLEIDSSYNTYLYDGLPPTPIGNPGLQAIRAVLYPIESDYFYYITGKDGVFYYAETFDEHRDNIAKYLQ